MLYITGTIKVILAIFQKNQILFFISMENKDLFPGTK